MANQEHLDLLRQGVKAWNTWRQEHRDIHPDLSNAFLIEDDISGADLRVADLSHAYLEDTSLDGANLNGANLRRALLRGASLSRTTLSRADLSGANLNGVNLMEANLVQTDLSGSDLRYALLGLTQLAGIDLRSVKGLETVEHIGPSYISTSTLERSQGDIPEAFLRGAGLNDAFIAYARSLFAHPIEYYTLFISYSSHDQEFAERLYNDLQGKGVRCWFAPEDLKTGDKFRERIDESIRLYDKLLLVLSEHSVASPWVEKEVETVFEKEHRIGHLVLFPVKLDESVMQTYRAWAADIRRQRHILDFTQWKDHDVYQYRLARLLHDLKADGTSNIGS